jgi:hypothetical protein
MVEWLTPYVRPISVKASPVDLRAMASAIWNWLSLGFRPNLTPLACARLRPSSVRARIRWRSNCANPASTVIISCPCGVVVSAHASSSERNLAPLRLMLSRMFSRSRVERANLSSRVTRSTSPSLKAWIALANCLRSVMAPQIFSANIVSAPAAFSDDCCPSSSWLSVETLL